MLATAKVNAQDAVRTTLEKYLVSTSEIDSAVYKTKQRKGKIETITNYFIDSLGTYTLGNYTFRLYKFGSYTEHTKPHFALFNLHKMEENCIVDNYHILSELSKISDFIQSYNEPVYQTEKIRVKIFKALVAGYSE